MKWADPVCSGDQDRIPRFVLSGGGEEETGALLALLPCRVVCGSVDPQEGYHLAG